MNLRRLIQTTTALAVVWLGGCAVHEVQRETAVAADNVTSVVNAVSATTTARLKAEAPLYTRVRGLWVSARSTAMQPAEALPAVFERPVVYKSTNPVTIASFAKTIQQLARVNVQLVGEARQPTFVHIEHEGSLRSLLAVGAERLGVAYRWADGNLEIIQSEAKTYPIMRVAQDAGGVGSRPVRDPYAEIEGTLKVIAPTARIVVSRSTNSITVVDRPQVMREIERYIAFDAEQGAKSVTLRWQLVNYSASKSGEAGAAVNYLLARSGGTASIVGGASAASTADTLKISITDPTSIANGSNLVLSLLNQNGQATVVRDGLLTVHNNDVREYKDTSKIAFAAKTTLASVPNLTTGTGSINSVVPIIEFGSEEIGLTFKVAATVHPSDDVDMSLDFSMVLLNRLKQSASAIVTQEFPETSRKSTSGRLRGRHGDSFVLGMDVNDTSFYDRRAGAGFSVSGQGKQEQWLLLITPVITRGAL